MTRMRAKMKILSFFVVALLVLPRVVAGETSASPIPVPFKAPQGEKAQWEKTLNDPSSRVLVVAGAGINGLAAVRAIMQTGLYTHAIVIEKRKILSRFNTLSLRKQVLTRFDQLGILERFKDNALFSNKWTFSLFTEYEPIHRETVYTPDLLEVDFASTSAEVFAKDLDSHFAVEMVKLQKMLADEILAMTNVFLLHGTIEIIPQSDDKHSVKFTLDDMPITIEKPQLIVIAEGARSKTREKLGIEWKAILDKPSELWCSGIVSLEGIIPKKDLVNDISIVVDSTTDEGAFGVIRSPYTNLFLNSAFKEHDHGDVNACLKRAARLLLLQRRADFPTMNLTEATPLVVDKDHAISFTVNFVRAERAYYGKNIVLTGDSYVAGSPVGGIGASLGLTTGNKALEILSRALLDEKIADKAFMNYDQAMQELAYQWHFGGLQ